MPFPLSLLIVDQAHTSPAHKDSPPPAVAMTAGLNPSQGALDQGIGAASSMPSNADSQHPPPPPGRRTDSIGSSKRGRGRGRGRGGARHHNPVETGGDSRTGQSPLHATPPAGLIPGDADNETDVVIRMEDLMSRGVVTKIGDLVYQIPPDILLSGRSSITIGAAVGGDKRRFNLKWLYDYHWLRFDPSENSMLCAMCKSGKRANQFAKLGSKNFKTSALVDHSTSNDHKRSLAQSGPLDVGSDPAAIAIAFVDGVWAAQSCGASLPLLGLLNQPAPLPLRFDSAANTSDEQLRVMECRPDIATKKEETSLAASFAEAVGPRTVAQQSVSANSYSTVDSVTTTVSRTTATETQPSHSRPREEEEEEEQQQGGARSRVASKHLVGGVVSAGSSAQRDDGRARHNSAVPDERYAKEFEHAVQALLQAMNLNLPISSVANLYRLQIQPTPLADIGSHGRSGQFSGAGSSEAVRLAGAYTNSTEAARTLQHVVSSELLSLIKDEVSQSPAFSVIIDEAPLREHNSLVAHVLLYLRYLRRDPESETGELQAITRFWRCVHLYHESNGRLARRDPISLVLTLLERAKIDSSRLVCISCERPVTHEDEEVERRRHPHIIHWHGIFTYPNSLSPQVYEEVTNRSEDFVHFSMTLMDLCLFMYSHPSSFAFLGVEFQEMLYKTLYEIFLGEGSISTRLPISLTPAIVIALTRNISQIMATVLALSRVSTSSAAAGVNMPDHRAGDAATPAMSMTPKSPRSSLQIPLPIVDMLVSSYGGRIDSQQSVGRCPPADALLESLRDYSFLGCLHFMADILSQIKPIIDIAGRSDMPTRVFGALSEPADHTLDQRLRAYIGTIRDTIESLTIMYGEEEVDETHEHVGGHSTSFGSYGEEEFSGFHLNEFMHLTDKEDEICHFRSFAVVNYSRVDSQTRLIELIRTVSSAILHDLHQRFSAKDIATIQALADMWDPTQFPRDAGEVAMFANGQALMLTKQMSPTHPSVEGLKVMVPSEAAIPPGSSDSLSPIGAPLVDPAAVLLEWGLFKAEVHQQAEAELGPAADAPMARYVPGKIQQAYRKKLFPAGALAQSMRRLRSVEDSQARTNLDTQTASQSLLERLQKHSHGTYSAQTSEAWTKFGNLAKLGTAWNVLPLALSTDLHFFRRFYERQLGRICREQAENKLQSINFDIGDTFSELISRLSSPQKQSKKKRVTVYDLLQNSKVEVEQNIGSVEKPVHADFEVSGVTVDYFVRSIDAVTMALDHRLRLLSLEFTESPVAVSKTPGDCPKWLQNAMRGYWKLACRPPKSSSKATAISLSASHATRHRAHTMSNNAGAVRGGIAPWSTSSTSQVSDLPHEVVNRMASGKQCKSLLSSGSEAGMVAAAAASAPLPLPPLPMSLVLNSGVPSVQTSILKADACSISPSKSSIGRQLSISAVICATVQPTASDDMSNLPLLEALLSDPTNVPVPPLPPQNPAVANCSGIKRPFDAGPGTVTNAMGGGGQQQGSGRGEAAAMMAAAAAAAGNKRVRHSADSAMVPPTDPYGHGSFNYQQGYADAGGGVAFQRQQRQQAGVREGESFDNAIVRLTSDMGLDSANTRAFASSLPNQLMPPPSSPAVRMDNTHAANVFTGMQQQQVPHRYSQLQQQQLQQQYQAHIRRSESATSLQGPASSGDGMMLPHNYAAAQLVFASQAAALDIRALSGLPSAPVGGPQSQGGMQYRAGMHTATASSFDQMIHEQNRMYQDRRHDILPPPPPPHIAGIAALPPPPDPLNYPMHGFLPDNNSKQ
ncbi:hypothetical protein GGI20_001632 [Coemansia sp. BCRC 34301]|nr:hypothetical protein GGI20_001632 [Coemansia sp. BCRC 34301]